MKDKPLTHKLKYIFTYYWAAILGVICVLAFLVSWIGGAIFRKDTALSGYLLNGFTNPTYAGDFRQEFLEHLQLDSKDYECIFTSDIYYSSDEFSDTGVHVLEAITVQATTGNLDFIVTELESYNIFSAYLADMRTKLSAEQMEKWSDLFVYVETAALEELKSGEMEIVTLPEYHLTSDGLQNPFPIGIRLPDSCRLFDAYNYGGEHIIFGFFTNGANSENAIAFLEYIMQ